MNILIVKLGALGDVLRTTPLLSALKKKFPQSRVTWIVDPGNADVLRANRLIDQLVPYSSQALSALQHTVFDWAINLDKDEEALDSITAVSAKKKSGFGRSSSGALCALDPLSDYAYRLGIDDDLKFKKNKKTYQEISFEQAGLVFFGEDYLFEVDSRESDAARAHLRSLGFNRTAHAGPVVGLNTGSGHRFAGKKLPVASYVKLIEHFSRNLGAAVFLLGGKDEIERNREIEKSSSCPVINTGSHSILRFAAIVKECDLVVSGDTTAMHIAIAMKVPVVSYFASTCAAEIELYGRGAKIVSSIDCAPCYKRICPIDEQCMKDMDPTAIFNAAKGLLKRAAVR